MRRHIASLSTGRALCGSPSLDIGYPDDVQCDDCADLWIIERTDSRKCSRRAAVLTEALDKIEGTSAFRVREVMRLSKQQLVSERANRF